MKFRTCCASLLRGWGGPLMATPLCTISSAPPVVFGVYNALLSNALDAQTSVTFTCTGSGSATLQVQLRAGLSGTVQSRAMTSANSILRYGLYQDTGRTQPWGDGTGGTSAVFTQVNANSSVTLPIYARVPAQQNAMPGFYSDVVTIQTNF